MTQAHPIPAAALAAHLAILGKTGAGKTFAARTVVERILSAGERACIVDPTGVWWGLRLGADGKARSRFPAVIAGGRHGDVPLSEDDGPALARIVGTSSTPVILDVSGMTVSARTRFFTGFAEHLIIENVEPLHLVLDEAHLFAPQGRVHDPGSAAMVHATNNLVSLGRARGLRILLLTQRPAKLHKDSLTQVETMVAMRLVAPQDRKAVEEWIAGQADKKQGSEIVASLPGLEIGEAWIWAPTVGVLERTRFPAIATYDSMRPEAQGVRDLPPVDVAAIRAALASPDTNSAAEEGTSAKRRPAEDISAKLTAAEEAGYARGLADSAAWIGPRLQAFADAARSLVAAIEAEVTIANARWSGQAPTPTVPSQAAAPEPDAAATERKAAQPAADAGGIPLARRKILDAIAWLNATGQPEPSRQVVALLAQVSSKSGGYRNNLGALKTAGLIRYPGSGTLALTKAGRAAAWPPAAALTHAAMMERIAQVLAPARMRLLQAAAAVHPAAIAREDLAATAGVSASSGGFRNNLGGLSSLGLVTYPAAGEVRAADLLFPSGKGRAR